MGFVTLEGADPLVSLLNQKVAGDLTLGIIVAIILVAWLVSLLVGK